MFKMQQIIPLSLSFAYVMIYLKHLDDKGGIILTYGIVFLGRLYNQLEQKIK